MAEAPETELSASSSEIPIIEQLKDVDEPIPKKRKINDVSDKLEHRLGGILCCAVCLELPLAAVYQCSNGHLMCAPCFTHLLADAHLRGESATCPNCRVVISRTSASRNLAVEKTVSELPIECKFCTVVFPRHALHHHEEKLCEDRLSGCKYACIGCPWRGPVHERSAHEARCPHPQHSAGNIVDTLAERDRQAREELLVYSHLLDLLSCEKITFTDLQLKPYRTEEYVHKLFYESSRFPAFSQHWVVKAFVNKNQPDPTQSTQRNITYQLILSSRGLGSPVVVQWVAARGPWGEARLLPRVSSHTFREEEADAPPQPLPLADPEDANRLLATKAIHFRLIMFLTTV